MNIKLISRSVPLRRTFFLLLAVAALFIGLILPSKVQKVQTSAYSTPAYVVQKYDVDVTVARNREISFLERITVYFNRVGPKKEFYRSLPIEGDQYYDFEVKGINNPNFSYYIADNPDVEGFMDINMTGGVEVGATFTCEISYKMLLSIDEIEDGMRLDVIGSGWPAELHDVTVNMHFPDSIRSYQVYSGGFGEEDSGTVQKTLSSDGKTLTLKSDLLPLTYNDVYFETMAEGITVEFDFEQGVLVSPFASRFFTKRMLVVAIVGVIAVVAAFFVRAGCKTKREIVTVVNVKPPNEMDPMFMGKTIDSSVDSEDITSMIYYFANKGWIDIDFTDPKDAVLIRKTPTLPSSTPVYVSTLFEGLFKGAGTVKISSLANKYYVYIDAAKVQLSTKDVPRYEKKSKMGLIVCLLLSAALIIGVPFAIGLLMTGGGYMNFTPVFMMLGVGIFSVILFILKDKQYKLKKVSKVILIIVAVLITIFSSLIYGNMLITNVMSVWEKVVLTFFALATALIGVDVLSRTEKYNQILGDILGFKDFIVYTEKDKIKEMLQINPQLMYDILPYAQVLGVTNEWEDKFKDLLIDPPAWCVGNSSVYNYYVMSRYLRTSTRVMQIRPQQSSGSSVGRSGGGGRSGGFSGGGRGGGGGGVR